jgi:hypothetical protein
MWHLQGMLLYRSIEHRMEERNARRDRVEDDFLNPYASLSRDPRVNPEEAKKIAA